MVQEYQTKLAQYEKESATVGDAVNQTRSQEMQDMGSRIKNFKTMHQKHYKTKRLNYKTDYGKSSSCNSKNCSC